MRLDIQVQCPSYNAISIITPPLPPLMPMQWLEPECNYALD